MSTWDEVVSAALVGARTRPIGVDGADPLIGAHLTAEIADPAVLSLQVAALTAAARNASGCETTSATAIPEEPDDPRPPMSALAAAYAERALELSPGMAQWCLHRLAASGLRPPPSMLPDLLRRTARSADVRPAITVIVGFRGRWLARHAPELKAVLDDAATLIVTDDLDDSDWTHGELADRAAYLAALRERDPDAARELLAAGWAAESGPDRELLLPILSRRLSAADEDFLERALDDRRAKVRASAAEILDHLDGSAHRQRLIAAASALLELGSQRRGLVRRHIVRVTLPTAPDPALARDGISLTAPRGIGVGRHVLTQLVSRIPPRSWEEYFELSPDEIVAAIDPDEIGLIHGLCTAAVAFSDSRWATALLAQREALPMVVSLADRQVVIDTFAALTVERQLVALGALPSPWPEALARSAFTAVLKMVVSQKFIPRATATWFGMLATGLPATDTWRATVDAARETYPVVTTQLATLAEALRIRSVLDRELE
ncbi:DUF5691 domain-containing protein [Gordonia sp. L191]|uniref:DUF5691 domain-containing protein n=1 Tax=Gordonia sp. L191 TaxID=2982699 RepID=UPI0024C007F9|nr:DUF5691 domain-containing protein [Gordonia sp. L191]WHU46807.1 DUF5691 domain-containing protein [Gordonia sp. L191]